MLWCGSFEEGLQSALTSEIASVGMWRSLVKTVARAGGNQRAGIDGWDREKDPSLDKTTGTARGVCVRSCLSCPKWRIVP